MGRVWYGMNIASNNSSRSAWLQNPYATRIIAFKLFSQTLQNILQGESDAYCP
jgi:hypothetical protein